MSEGSAGNAVRHSILELSPLELDCMNALWPLGEARVRDIQQALVPVRPRAYTTIMTTLDRLAQKGVVMRQKAGRAWIYRASLSADEARAHAVTQVLAGFFEGSPAALGKHLAALGGSQPMSLPRDVTVPSAGPNIQKPGIRTAPEPRRQSEPALASESGHSESLDTTLL